MIQNVPFLATQFLGLVVESFKTFFSFLLFSLTLSPPPSLLSDDGSPPPWGSTRLPALHRLCAGGHSGHDTGVGVPCQ